MIVNGVGPFSVQVKKDDATNVQLDGTPEDSFSIDNNGILVIRRLGTTTTGQIRYYPPGTWWGLTRVVPQGEAPGAWELSHTS